MRDENINHVLNSLDPELKLTAENIYQVLIISRIDELDEKTLDLLAWQFHVDFYDLAGNLKMKREAVKNSLLWHMKKGTEWAIHEALRQLGISAKFHPWWETGGEPYTFKLDAIVTDDYYRRAPDNRITENIRRAVEETKSARSYMSELKTRIEFNEQNNLYVAHITHKHIYMEMGVDLAIMHELLIMFEKRIFERFDNHERKLELELVEKYKELKLELDQIKDLLKWRNS